MVVRSGGLAVLLLLGMSCGDSEHAPPDTTGDGLTVDSGRTPDAGQPDAPLPPEGILGDWFNCLDLDCHKIGYSGWRFLSDGQISSLFGIPPALENDELYCHTENPQLGFTYSYAGSQLKVATNSKPVIETTYEITISGNTAQVYDPYAARTVPWMRVFPPRDAGSCAKRSPWICPEFGRTGGPSDQSCQWSFVCDNGEFKVDCTMAGPTYTCTCIENDSKQVGQFSLADACATADALEKEANAACGWELWKPPLVPLPPAP